MNKSILRKDPFCLVSMTVTLEQKERNLFVSFCKAAGIDVCYINLGEGISKVLVKVSDKEEAECNEFLTLLNNITLKHSYEK